MKRRKFIKKAGSLVSLGVIVPSLLIEACSSNEVSPANPTGTPSVNFDIDLTVSAYQSLNTVGSYIYKNGIIIASTTSGFIALSRACTHQGCSVTYSSSSNNFPCPCHGASFNTNGAVLGGPTSTPLKKYTVSRNGNILTISG